MKALTLHQPWASLIAAGIKRFETRSWVTAHRGPLLIHAGTGRTFGGEELLEIPLVQQAVSAAGLPARLEDYPTGAILCQVELLDCRRLPIGPGWDPPTVLEGICGDWSPGRIVWELSPPQSTEHLGRLATVGVKGHQGLWEYRP